MAYVEILVGTSQWSSGGERYSIKTAIPHEHYDDPEYANDIALIRLLTPIKFNENVQPIKFSSHEVPDNTGMQVYGFGRLASIFFFFIFKFV